VASTSPAKENAALTMATSYDDLRPVLGKQTKPLAALNHLWRRLAPAKALLCAVSFQLAFSFVYILFFARSFSLGKRIIVLHLSITSCLIVVVTLGLGSLLLSKRIREWRLTRFILAVIIATGTSAVIVLYFVDYVGNSLWGSSINYELAAQYLLGRGIFQKELQILPGKLYLIVAAAVVTTYAIYLGFSGPLFRSLKELFGPDGELSIFRNRRRVLISCASICLGLLLLAWIGVQSTRVESPYRDRILLHEPIVSLVANTGGLDDFVSYGIRTRLEAAERSVRADYRTGQSFEKKNVIIIMVDSLRADHLQAYGYERSTTPFLTSLLKTGRVRKVEMAMSTCADTTCGVRGTLSSRTLSRQIPQSFKLSDLLFDQGYQVYFILSGSHRWYSLRESYGTSLTSYFDGTSSDRYDWTDDRIIFEGLERVPDYTGTPSFFYFHLMSPHVAGIKQEAYRKYTPAQNWIEAKGGELSPSLVTNYYDNGILQADAIIKGIFESLKQKGYLDTSLVVILADHGEALGQRDRSLYGHVNDLYQEYVRIPLLIYDDSEANYANLNYATQLDVAPTVLDRLGLEIPSNWQGRSLLGPDAEPYSFHQTRTYPSTYAVVYRTDRATYKYLKHSARDEELYELISDPGETQNLVSTADPAIIERMRAKLAESLADF
jgi:sulfatase-like protein